MPNGKGAFKLQWKGMGTWQSSDGSFRDHVYEARDCFLRLFLSPLRSPNPPRKAPKLQETSLQAHRSQKDKAPTDCMVVYNRLRKYPRGATCDRLEQALGMSHQTTSARLNDLARRGKIVDSGRREKTRTGRPAICWKIVP